MPWLQLRLNTTEEFADTIGDALMAMGALSVTLMDAEDIPILEPAPGETPLWQNIQMMVLFDAQTDTDHLLCAWRENTLSQHSQDEKFELLEDKDWEREWMDRFEPMKFGERLWICPSWKPIPDQTAVNVMLDPGLAFGTGTHPTTALCLNWLDSLDLQGKTVIDFGCGSGILAIAALKLGAKTVYAVDIDPQAILATEENAKRNDVFDERLVIGKPEAIEGVVVDVIVANILAGPLESLAPQISAHCDSRGKLALSGLLDSQAEAISQTYAQWFEMDPPTFKDEWTRLSGTKVVGV
ncbi:50S ribosomal protein L11 methyltransferase [Aliikangiella marina]|uniref:Ribosomal protein L11 methyltransferase n=1 Tax=Aliikangiella marina TaxID=1712262 RepID=A0A545T5F6_9GAMM|nr:50S ribosomal protein L11 methyltransferase [Aliikangiella marina]TQV72398.1 50S ribosomal protein L11 methyltransferase [Aliikangiella marina]